LAADAGLAPGHWEPRILWGEASLRPLKQEQTLDADPVILGEHGQSAAEDVVLSSVTRYVLTEGGCEVLVRAARRSFRRMAEPAN